ncbi:hypothetical protein [Kitasatospora aureofaciens]|uniref:hypothetical protein n=1 Tax=Kitasatospora aureofaciens TaxID=1894 RepID=UPI001C45D4DA|nr:hypothetical protein [Kitasatospora aureofaciens]MBV6699160.1 hypothetical protein [Kitasatospora aureofaciens]
MGNSEIDDELNAAIRASDSPSWSVRAAAGRHLAAYAHLPAATDVLRRLLLDGQDTAVTQETAEALLERRDTCGLRLVLAAFADADHDSSDHLNDAIICSCLQSDEDRAHLQLLCSHLTSDPDETVRAEAAGLLLELRPRGER